MSIIVDIDGTIADNLHRQSVLEVSVARNTAPAHRHMDTVTNIMETLELRR